MIKKIFIALLLAAGAIGAVAPQEASAQKYSGRWSLYPRVGTSITQVADAGEKVYYITGGMLYHYSGEDNETYAYNVTNRLSDSGISNIYYDPTSKMLLVAYTNGNIDIIDTRDDTVRNVADIKGALLSVGKGIRDVAFKARKAYLATDFGMAILDMDSATIEQSGIYGFGVQKIAVTDNFIVLYFWEPKASGVSDYALYTTPLGGKINNFSAFTKASGAYLNDIEILEGDAIAATDSSKKMYLMYTIDPETGLAKSAAKVSADANEVSDLITGLNGQVYCYGTKTIFTIAGDGTPGSLQSLPEDMQNMVISVGKNISDVWAGSKRGLGRYNFSSGSEGVVQPPYFPEGTTVPYAYYMQWSKDGSRLWFANQGGSQINSTGGGFDNLACRQFMNYIEDGKIHEVTVEEATCGWSMAIEAGDSESEGAMFWPALIKVTSGETGILGGPQNFVLDPDDPDLTWTAVAAEGIYAAKNGEQVAQYCRVNAPLLANGYPCYNVNIDPQGNLWTFLRDGTNAPAYIASADARKNRPGAMKWEDWTPHPLDGEGLGTDIISLFHSKTNLLLVTTCGWEWGIVMVDTRGTYGDPSDDTAVHHWKFVDQDNNSFCPIHITSMVEDHDGKVWVTSEEGMFVIEDFSGAMGTTMKVRRPVVPRNDGTQYGDYLLDGSTITGCAVDPVNRKWFSTGDAGVYLVSADGTKILENFTSSNSNLPNNAVYSVSCDPTSNRVFFCTESGLVQYESDASPAEEDYSGVYAYPNPVRPEYTGWITIAGLMDDSLVKIADMSGRVVFQGRSSGGNLIWDGCNSAGQRVQTGVYLVLASQKSDPAGASAIVTKIMVMN